ncbi:hypothetical protein D0Z08_19335 [Nocardioides immobilis]|uniref:Uncharacterized protein n=1 Tax=Nocardioides immobilis TaxID=2049295 RepID=A0A417XYE3_9ACTN|nr:hypothetical protein [Nocardioides immobilis]RHW25384.1 hypothetical protein D0Z08_19335 [Nocardioides immobilis]
MPKKHGRGRGRQPQRRRPSSQPRRADGGPEDQELFQTLRKALRSGEPLDFLAIISGFLEVTDPRGRDPFAPDEQRAGLNDLVDSFIGTSYAETTAALTAIRALSVDEVLSARIVRELETRRQPMPDWLTGLDRARIDPDVWFMTHVLGDGDDYLLGVTLPSGHALSALVYVDHNLGTVVKDAFIVPEPLEDLAIKMGTMIDDADQSLTRTDPATTRAVVEAAIDFGSQLYPPLTSDSWPMCRPLVEWMLRMLPTGGKAPDRREWPEEERAAIAEGFFASSYGAPLDHADERDLLGSVLWFGTSYATGDPFRWSPVTVEMLLADWFPRKVIAEPAYLAKLPDLVRAYIGYCHDRNGIRGDLTEETLAAVDQWEPEYLQLINSDRQKAMAGLAEALFESQRLEDLSDEEIHLEYIADEVGGVDALMKLDAEPLPDEEFQWAGIDEEIRPTVQAIIDECDACADAMLDIEHRTAMRRFLARAARNNPKLFRRKGSPVRGAGAVAWVIATANRTIGSYRSPMTGKDLLGHFDITGSVSERAQSLIRAAGIDLNLTYGSLRVGDPGLLISRRRGDLVDDRDRTLAKD